MKALIADVDDTLCPSTRPMGPEMAKEIGRIIRGGVQFAFISGSTLDQIFDQVAPQLKEPHHLLGASGTHYVKVFPDRGAWRREEVHRRVFTENERAEILGAFEELIGKYNIQTLTTKEDQLQDRGSQITLSALGRHAPDDKKRAFDPDGARRKIWLEFLKPKLAAKYVLRVGGTSSLDITPAGLDKAWGIRKFLEHNLIQPSEALFLGDKLGPEGNDYPALSVVDCVQVRDPSQALEFLRGFLPARKE